jgi:hypothetical protein
MVRQESSQCAAPASIISAPKKGVSFVNFMGRPLTSTCPDFRNPRKAFEEMLRIGDGGTSYIVENLSRVCRPETKPAFYGPPR